MLHPLLKSLRLGLVFLVAATVPALAGQPEVKTSPKGMTYSIRLPDGYAKGQHQLVLGLHGAGDNCRNFMQWLTQHDTALPNGAILLVPQALADGAWDKPDLDPLAELVRTIQAEHQPPRTIGLGFSRGAYYIQWLAFSFPELLHGAIPCAGGSPGPVPDSEILKKLPFYVIHGDADDTVPFEEGQKAFAALEAKKVLCKFEKVAGLKHTVDWDALKRGVGWIGGILDERDKAAENEIAAKITALEAALKEKSWEAAAQGFAGLAKVPRALAPKLAALAKPHVMSANEPLALAAIEASGRCGADGVPALKSIPVTNLKLATAAATALGATGAPTAVDPLLVFLKASKEAVSIAAAESLGRLGGDAATKALVAGLATTESGATQDGRKAAMLASLKTITGQTFVKSSEWKKWLAERARDANK